MIPNIRIIKSSLTLLFQRREILPNPPFSKEGIELVPLFEKEGLGEI